VIFEQWLKESLKTAKLTHTHAAQEIGVSRTTLVKWIVGKSVPRVHHLWRFCELVYPTTTEESYILATYMIREKKCGK
tara:strand:- start:433 stop:666 length:234 start_codon:yes stop_codon:yes gene_type:complete